MYKDFAYIYDSLMKNVDYDQWTSFIETIFRKYDKTPKTIADLACGTGGITNLLAKRGYQVTGVDISEDMLAVAREKARLSGLRVPYIRQNIVELELHRPMDAITCMCDGINYITKTEDLEKTFSRVHSYLKPGGIFVFDISSYYKLSSILGNNIMADTGQEISLIWINKFDKAQAMLEMNLTFFVKEKTRALDLYKRSEETHLQKAYQQEEIVQLLRAADFTDIICFSPFSLEAPKIRSQRLFFAAVRK